MAPRVLMVGAYERDNFGDILFSELTRRYLTGMEVTAGSIMPAMLPGGEAVLPYAQLLRQQRWDAVWIVGGEIGGLWLDGALSMSLQEPLRETFVRATPVGKSFIARLLGQEHLRSLAYLPRLGDYPFNSSIPLVANSIGISNVGFIGDEEAAALTVEALAGASVFVRDDASAAFARSRGLKVGLGPDMVHAISLLDGFHADEVVMSPRDPYALVQVNVELMRNEGLARIAQSISELARITSLDIMLFAAGTAYAHDSIGSYAGLAAMLRTQIKPRRVIILGERDPLTLVRYIANAALWSGTSLHGRIVSSSYGVPRISLENDKVSRYVETWDAGFPYGVAADSMHTAAAVAIETAPDATARRHSEHLARTAHQNTRSLVEALR